MGSGLDALGPVGGRDRRGGVTWLLRRHPASRVSPFTLLVPPVGIGAAWVALGERPNPAELAGTAVVLVGLALVASARSG
jgi:O-acetylserine/cysteine efflux transporter